MTFRESQVSGFTCLTRSLLSQPVPPAPGWESHRSTHHKRIYTRAKSFHSLWVGQECNTLYNTSMGVTKLVHVPPWPFWIQNHKGLVLLLFKDDLGNGHVHKSTAIPIITRGQRILIHDTMDRGIYALYMHSSVLTCRCSAPQGPHAGVYNNFQVQET